MSRRRDPCFEGRQAFGRSTSRRAETPAQGRRVSETWTSPTGRVYVNSSRYYRYPDHIHEFILRAGRFTRSCIGRRSGFFGHILWRGDALPVVDTEEHVIAEAVPAMRLPPSPREIHFGSLR